MKRFLVISGLTIALAALPAAAQQSGSGMRGGGMGRGGGLGHGCGMGGMYGGMMDRMRAHMGGGSRGGMWDRSRGDMGRSDRGETSGPRTRGMDDGNRGGTNGNSDDHMVSRENRSMSGDRRGSDQYGIGGTHDNSVGGMAPERVDTTPNRNQGANVPNAPARNGNQDRVQQMSSQQGHERHQH